jgi:hypothetical protein
MAPIGNEARIAFAALVLLAGSGCATLTGPAEVAMDPALERCDGESGERLRYLEPKLGGQAVYAKRWWMAWNVIHGGGIVFSGALAATEHGRGERASEAVDAVKGAIGLSENLLHPPLAKQGTAALASIDPSSPEGCARRLALAEALLYGAAEQSHRERRTFLPHVANLALNLIGALVVAEGFHEGSGWGSGALGLVIGEVQIWTYPWQAERTLREYRARFGGSREVAHWRSEKVGDRVRWILE